MTTEHARAIVAALSLVLVTGCSKQSPGVAAPTAVAPAVAADVIYVGGDIVTVNDAQPTAEALAVKDGRIVGVGTRSEIESTYNGDTTTLVELAGKTLLPGFIDPHSHFIDALSMADRANISAPPRRDLRTTLQKSWPCCRSLPRPRECSRVN
jgi:hypothetical protein